jgi:hypothetical protein
VLGPKRRCTTARFVCPTSAACERNNPLERLLREVRRRTQAVGVFQDSKSALIVAAARLRPLIGKKRDTRRDLVVNPLAQTGEAKRTGIAIPIAIVAPDNFRRSPLGPTEYHNQHLCLRKCAKNLGHWQLACALSRARGWAI